MSYKHSKHETKKYSILVDKKEVSDLNKFLLKYFNEVKYGGKTNDNTELQFDNINHLLEYPNHKERKFVKINIECRKGKSDESAGLSISLGNDYSSFTETIRYYLRYDDLDWGFRFDDELRKHLRELKTWYSPLTKFNLTIGILILFLVLILLIGGIDSTMKIFGYSGYIQYSDSSQKGGHYFGVVLGLFLFAIGYVCELIKGYLFPKIFFSLGKQEKNYKKRQTVTYVLFGVIVLGIIINLFSTWIYSG